MHLVKAGGQEISNSFQGSLSNYRDFNLEKNGGFHKTREGGVAYLIFVIFSPRSLFLAKIFSTQ